jgi:tRNA(Ile2) C34 agmatinyltransferase TiaS
MQPEKYERSIPLYCPTCGGTDFSEEGEFFTCTACSLRLTKDDLIARNGENIDAHVKEVQRELTADVQRELKKKLQDAFRGSKFIKIK